jgi:hypothetical protein
VAIVVHSVPSSGAVSNLVNFEHIASGYDYFLINDIILHKAYAVINYAVVSEFRMLIVVG